MANQDPLSEYLAALRPMRGQPGLFTHGNEALYADDLSFYDRPQLQAPESYLSGLEASPAVELDTGSELTVKAVQIFLSLAGYKGSNGKPLAEDGTWGANSASALSAWQKANAGKSGISQITIDQRRGRVWAPSNIASDMRAKLKLNPRGRAELAKQPSEKRAPTKTDARNAIPSGAGEASAGAGNAFETAVNLRGILRALDVPVAPRGNADTELVKGWQRAASAFRLNPAISAQTGAVQVAVNANTLSALRTKARASGKGTSAPVTRLPGGAGAGTTSTSKAAPTAGTLPVQTTEVQRVLRALGWSKTVAADGKFGPKTKAAWESSATNRKLDKTISGGAGSNLVNVNSTTLARLQQDAALGASKGSSTSIEPVQKQTTLPVSGGSSLVAAGGTLIVPTSKVQSILVKLRWAKNGLTDGKYGPRTQSAWSKSAQNRGIDAQISSEGGGRSVLVSAATLARLERDAAAGYVNPPYGPAGTPAVTPSPIATPVAPVIPIKPAGKDAETAPKSGLAKVQVGTLQDLLLKLKYSVGKKGRDGEWGPNTQKAWVQAAKNRKLDSTISRASPMEAWVSPKTLEQLSLAANGTVVKPDEKKPPPSADDKSLVAIDNATLGTVLRGFNKKAKSLPEIVAAWKEIAKAEKVDDRANLTKGVFYAVKNTADTLAREAAIRISITELVALSDTSVPVASLQDAITFWSNRDDTKKVYGKTYKPATRGTWDANTLTWTLRYFNIQAGLPTTVWERALPRLVAKDKQSLKLAKKFVQQIGVDASNFKKVEKIIDKKEAADKKNASVEKKWQDLLNSRVQAATVVVSVKALQQALSELHKKYTEGKIKLPAGSPKPGSVGRTGAWDAKTRDGTLLAYGNDILGKLPVGLADDLFKRVVYTATTGGKLAGLDAVVSKAYIRVPPTVAKYIAEDASAWVRRTKEKPVDQTVVIPTGGGNNTVQLDPALITGRVPGTTSNIINTENVRNVENVRNIENSTSSSSNTSSNTSSNSSSSTAEETPSAGPMPIIGGDPNSLPPAPEPTPAAEIAPAAPVASSGAMWPWLLGGAAAVGIGLSMRNKAPQKRGARKR